MAQWTVIGLDMTATLKVGETLGYDASALGELLPSCESGMTTAINAKINEGLK